MTTYATGLDDGRIYCDVIRNGRHVRRYVSTGERPFASEDEARKHARKRERSRR